jgi:hypothetical protein
MDHSFFAYLQQLELMAFFSGYPLVYTITLSIAWNRLASNQFNRQLISLLPFAYALVGTLFLGFQIKKLYPDYSIENLKLTVQQPWLVIWGLLSILFWIPSISKKRVLSLIHSFVFFLFLVRDLFLLIIQPSTDRNIVTNDMKMIIASIVLNLGSLAVLLIFSLLFIQFAKRVRS